MRKSTKVFSYFSLISKKIDYFCISVFHREAKDDIGISQIKQTTSSANHRRTACRRFTHPAYPTLLPN
jgi:hypothetical protein